MEEQGKDYRMPDYPTSADAEWKRIQQNTFTRWCNENLKTVDLYIYDLEKDLCDGRKLIALLQCLSHKTISRYNKKPIFRSQKKENIAIALKFIENEEIKLVNIDASDILKGRIKLILGLVWTLILKYQISLPMISDDDGGLTPKQALMTWVNSKISPHMTITNFSKEWNSGKAVGAVVNATAPGLCPEWSDWDPADALHNVKRAMKKAEDWLGIPQVITPEELANPNVDELSVMTYMSYFPESKLKPGALVTPESTTTDENEVSKAISMSADAEGVSEAQPTGIDEGGDSQAKSVSIIASGVSDSGLESMDTTTYSEETFINGDEEGPPKVEPTNINERGNSTAKATNMDEEISKEACRMADDPTSQDAEWKRIQQNTFTRWCNENLKNVDLYIYDLEKDLCDGLKLIALLQCLSHKKIPDYNKKPTFRPQKIENIAIALKFIENEEIKLVNIDASDILKGRIKLILGLVWTLILKYQISLPMISDDDGGLTPKQALVTWVNSKISPHMTITNFSKEWNSGKAIGAVVNAVAPGLCPEWNDWNPADALQNVKRAMKRAEDWLGIPQVISPEELSNPNVDELSVMTYLSYFPECRLKAGAPLSSENA